LKLNCIFGAIHSVLFLETKSDNYNQFLLYECYSFFILSAFGEKRQTMETFSRVE